jgi:hypothetical protein
MTSAIGGPLVAVVVVYMFKAGRPTAGASEGDNGSGPMILAIGGSSVGAVVLLVLEARRPITGASGGDDGSLALIELSGARPVLTTSNFNKRPVVRIFLFIYTRRATKYICRLLDFIAIRTSRSDAKKV